MLTEDDTYDEYHFPKGTVFFANAWSIHRDEKEYDTPDEFVPERFLQSKFGTRDSSHGASTQDESRRVTYGTYSTIRTGGLTWTTGL